MILVFQSNKGLAKYFTPRVQLTAIKRPFKRTKELMSMLTLIWKNALPMMFSLSIQYNIHNVLIRLSIVMTSPL